MSLGYDMAGADPARTYIFFRRKLGRCNDVAFCLS